MVDRLIRSPAVKAGFVYAVGGLCFAAGNLILARVLTPSSFAAIALVIAFVHLAASMGPLGADTIVNRNTVDASVPLFRRIGLSSLVVGLVAALLARTLYELAPLASVLTAVICTAAGINLVGSAFFRSRGRYSRALTLTQGHNVMLALAAIVTMFADVTEPGLPLGIIAVAYVVSAAIGWIGAARLERRPDALRIEAFPWDEGRTIIATTIAILVLLQFERLAIPKLLGNEALATFAVLAAIAGSAFRVLQMGIGYTLVPQLRNATSPQETRDVVRAEAQTAMALVTVGSVVVLLVTQPFIDWFLLGKYTVSTWMIVAAILAGLGKVAAAFGSAVVTALGSHTDLEKLRNHTWMGVALALAGALTGARFGLTGLLFGVAAGWTYYALASLVFARRQLRAVAGTPVPGNPGLVERNG